MSILLYVLVSLLLNEVCNKGFSALEDFHFKPLRRNMYFVEDYYRLYRLNLYADTAAHIANIYYLHRALTAAETNRFWAHPTKSLAYRHYDWTNPALKSGKKYPFRPQDPPFTMAHHAKYRVLMKMRISLLLVKSYLKLGSRYDRENLYWFHLEDYENLPYLKTKTPSKHYLMRSFSIAEKYYKKAQTFWKKCTHYVHIAWEGTYTHKDNPELLFREIDLQGSEMDEMENEVYKIYHQNNDSYKKEKLYYINNPLPEYNYTKVIQKKLTALNGKRQRLLTLIKTLKNN